MPSDRAKKRKEKQAAGKAKASARSGEDVDEDQALSGLEAAMKDFNVDEESHERSCTGVLASHPQSRDVHIDSFALLYHGHELLMDTRLELNFGR